MNDTRWLLEDKYGGAAGPAYERDRARLARGEPVDYVIGWKPFLGCRIDLTHRPFIPRPETEHWTEHVIRALREQYGTTPIRCLDMCSGSGCIAIALLAHLTHATVDCVDIREENLQDIRASAERNAIPPNRIRALKSNLFEHVEGAYDCITVNPPYLYEKSPSVSPTVSAWEPHEALFAPQRGLAVIERIIREAAAYLAQDGTLYLECDPWQKPHVEALAHEHGFFDTTFLRDQYGTWRVAVMHNTTA